ncbi:MAG TPA: PAS domain S-box protein [Bacteroidota bacterium]|nr:PAS domain S-box protein [Bacteroidota bacterium]
MSEKTISARDSLLVVDDEPDVLELIAEILSAEHYDVRTALGGAEALSSIQSNPPSLILLDLKMPRMDGFDVCRIVKSDPATQHIPVIIMSGLTEPGAKAEGYKSGAIDFISKPLVKEDVLAQIEVQLDLMHTHKELRETAKRLSEEVDVRKKVELDLRARQKEIDELLRSSERTRKALLGILEDQKLAEEKLAEALKYSQTIFETSPIGIITYSENGNAIAANRAAASMVGSTITQLQEQNYRALGSWEESGLKQAAMAAMESNEERDIEVFHKSTFGRQAWLSVRFVPFQHHGERQLLALFTDFSERKEKEQQYQTILQTAMDGFWIIDASGKLLEVNDAYCTMSGYSRSELLSMHIADLELIESQTDILDQITHIMEQGQSRFESRHRRKDGTSFDVEVSSKTLSDGSGRLMTFVRDITELKRAIEEVRKKERQQSLVLSSLPMAFYTARLAEDLGTIWMSSQVKQISGFDSQEFLKDPTFWSSRLHPEDRERILPIYSSVIKTGSANCEYRWKCADGVYRWFSDHITLARNELGVPVEAVGMWIDITARKRVENLLHESERFSRATIDALAAHICVIDQAGGIISVNRAWRDFAESNQVISRDVCEGANYLEVCDRAVGEGSESAKAFANAIRDIIGGKLDSYTCEYACHSPTEKRWFVGRATRFPGDGAVYLAIAHENITERKRSEQELDEERTLLKTIIDSIPDEIVVKDRDRRFILVNPAAIKALNKSFEEDVLGKRDEDLIPPQFAEEEKQIESEVMFTGVPVLNVVGRSRYNKVTKEIERSILISKIPLRDITGAISGIVVINRDITALERAKIAIENSEIRYRSLFEDAAIPIWELDFSGVKEELDRIRSSGIQDLERHLESHEVDLKRCAAMVRITSVNDESVRFFQVASKEELIHHAGQLFPATIWPVFREIITALAAGKNRFSGDISMVDARGSVKEVVMRLSVAPSARESMSRVLVSFSDITERKQFERELRKLSSAVEQSPVSVIITDTSGAIEYVNPTFEHVSGYLMSEVIGKNPRILKSRHTPQSEYKKLWDTILSGRQWRGEFRNMRKDGSLFWESALISPILDSEGRITHFLGIKEDITQKKMVEEELYTSRESLRLLAEDLVRVREEERSEIAREVHDELGQIMTAVKMDVSSLLRVGFSNPQMISQKAESLFSLIDMGIRSVQQLSARLRPGVLDDLGIVAAIEWQAEDFQARTGIKCILNLPETDLRIQMQQATAVFRIFQEGMTNVARHSKATAVEVTLTYDEGLLCLKIMDNGIGIDAAQIRNPKSLGLIGIRERLRPFEGSLVIEARPGGGTLMTVNLPIPKTNEEQA